MDTKKNTKILRMYSEDFGISRAIEVIPKKTEMVHFIRKLLVTPLGLKEDPDDFLRYDLIHPFCYLQKIQCRSLCPGCVSSSNLPEILVISGLVVFWILSGITQGEVAGSK